MLSPQEIERIEHKALDQRRIHDLGDESPIGFKVFSLLENTYNSYMLLYPLKTGKVAGFTRKQGELIQIFINTGFNLSFQIFAVAHELYHLIDLKEQYADRFIICNDRDISENMDGGSNIDEIKANYFAAAFLMPQNTIIKRFKSDKSKKIQEADIVLKIIEVQNEYELPYKTILKRLKELRVIDNEEFERLKSYEEKIFEYCKMMDAETQKRIYDLEHPNNRKYHTLNVPKMAVDAYKSNIISISKLENTIKKYDKELSDFNIIRPAIQPFNIDFSTFGTGDDAEDED